MGTRTWHLARASHHRKAGDYNAKAPDFIDWALVAYFYSAHELVHSVLSGEPSLSKDERHPRKHTSHGGPGNGGRGTNQLVRAHMGSIYKDYINLFEASQRTRYDIAKLGDKRVADFVRALDRIEKFTDLTNRTRLDIDTQHP